MTHTTFGPHLLGRRPSAPDARDFRLEAFLALGVGASDPLDDALAVLNASHAAKATKLWCTVATARIKAVSPAPPSPPSPDPMPTPAPTADVIWADPHAVLDQGNYGTCVGNGWAQFGNSDPVEDNFSEKDARAIYYEATVIDGQPDNPDAPGGGQQGSTVRSGAKAMVNRGRIKAYAFANSTDTITAWLRSSGPVVVGTDWTNDMFYPDAQGFVAPSGGVAGGHCYLLIGVSADGNVYTFLNSWGSSFGLGGRFKMKVSDFAGLLANQGEACTAVELPL